MTSEAISWVDSYSSHFLARLCRINNFWFLTIVTFSCGASLSEPPHPLRASTKGAYWGKLGSSILLDLHASYKAEPTRCSVDSVGWSRTTVAQRMCCPVDATLVSELKDSKSKARVPKTLASGHALIGISLNSSVSRAGSFARHHQNVMHSTCNSDIRNTQSLSHSVRLVWVPCRACILNTPNTSNEVWVHQTVLEDNTWRGASDSVCRALPSIKHNQTPV